MKSALQEILEGLRSLYSFKIRDYSGRGMYGRHCLSITTDHHSVHSFELALHVGKEAHESGRFDEVEDAVSDTREDSMGFGTVIYWPNVAYVKDEEEPYDDSYDDFEGC